MIVTSTSSTPTSTTVPMRTCVGCRQVAPQAQLLRLAVVGERVVADPGRRASGRGVYVHARPDCLRAAGKGGLARSLKRGVSRAELDAIAAMAADAFDASQGGADAVERAPHPSAPAALSASPPPASAAAATAAPIDSSHGAHGA